MKPGDRIKVGNQEHVAVKDMNYLESCNICSVRNECNTESTDLCKGNPVHFIVTDQIPIEPILDMLSEKNAEPKGKVFYYTEDEYKAGMWIAYVAMEHSYADAVKRPYSDEDDLRIEFEELFEEHKKK